MKKIYIALSIRLFSSVKKHYNQLAFFMVIMLCGMTGFGQLYWNGAGIWTTPATWGLVSGGPYGQTWATNSAVFDVPASTITGATIICNGITAVENVTVTPGGTFGTSGTVITIDVANAKTFDFAGQAISVAAGTGFIKSNSGVLAIAGSTYNGGFTLNGGTLVIRGVNAVGAGGVFTINNGTTICSNGNRNLSGKPSSITIGGDFTIGATTGLASPTATLTFDAPMALGSGTTRKITLGNTGNHVFNGAIGGVGSNLIVDATAVGKLTLGAINTYDGLTTVSAGTLQLNRLGGGTLPNTNNVLINGTGTLQISSDQTLNNLTLVAGATLTVDPGVTLTINGTFFHNGGTISPTGTIAYGAGGTLSYGGSSTQTTSSLEFSTLLGPSNLIINNTNGVSLHAPRTISGVLTFTTGKFTLGANQFTISNNASAAIVGHNTNSYVVTNGTGILQRAISATINSYDFPIGNTYFYKLANINFTTAPLVAGSLSARWNVGYPGWPNAGPLMEPNGGSPINLISVAYNGSWFLDSDIFLTGGVYTGTFTGNGDNVVINYLQTVLIKRPSTPPGQDWILDGTHVTTTGSNALYTLSRTGMIGFSEFAVGGIINVSLPINLNYLNGFKQNGSHNLAWKVTCTNNPNVTMSLERSVDNRTFTAITTITADAVRCEQPFSFTDNNPLKGINYYRLKMTDANGKITYSAAIALLNAATGFDIVGLMPTLVNNNAILNVTAAQKTKMDVIVTDIAGKQVQKIAYNLIAGSNQFSMNLSNLAAGTYQITGYTAEGKSKTIRFVKQ